MMRFIQAHFILGRDSIGLKTKTVVPISVK